MAFDASRLNSIALSSIGLLTLLGVLAAVWQQAPPAQPSDAPESEFAAGRAFLHLRQIAREPHPVGTAAHAAVRDYVLKTLSELGVPAEVQKSTAVMKRGNGIVAADLQNIVARLKGTRSGSAVLLVSHYDSTPAGPGASDDGHAVAAMLEVLRALRTRPPLENDMIFLFTDGEELGLLGAQVFAAEHRWANDVALALNFEARGNSGPAVMFETSAQNGALVAQFARAAPHPTASSLSAAIYEWMPNDTDLSVFKSRGHAGLNFAYIEGLAHYHTKLDNVDEIDLRSVQHQGANALALARHFGNAPLPAPKMRDACYFNLGTILVYYPAQWSMGLAIGGWLLLGAALFFAFRSGSVTAPRLLAGAVIVAFAALTGGGLATLFGFVLQRLRDPSINLYAGRYYFAIVVSVAVGWSSIVYALAGRRLGGCNLLGGALLLWGLLALATAAVLPGGSYLFIWPLAASAAAFLYVHFARARSAECLTALSLAAAPAFFFFGPLLHQVFEALAFSGIGMIAAFAAVVLALPAPSFAALTGAARLAPTLAAAAVGVGFLIPALAVDFDARHPKPDSLHYVLRTDRREALWVSAGRDTNWWTERFLTRTPQTGTVPEMKALTSQPMLKRPAPLWDIPAPEIQVLEDSPGVESRMVRLRVVNIRRAPGIALIADSAAEPRLVSLDGKPPRDSEMRSSAQLRAATAPSEWVFMYRNAPAAFTLTLEVKGTALTGVIVDQSFGLPDAPGANLPPRPPDTMPGDRWGESTWVSKRFELGGAR
jgi:hypothetical protein